MTIIKKTRHEKQSSSVTADRVRGKIGFGIIEADEK